MIQHWYRSLFRRFTSPCRASGNGVARRSRVRPTVEALEDRSVPATTSPFFLDHNGVLWGVSNTGNYVSTGRSGIELDVGVDGLGRHFAALRDANNRLWVYANDVWIDTGGYGINIEAGHRQVYVRDGNNQVWIYSLAGTSPAAWLSTGAWAIEMSRGERMEGGSFELNDPGFIGDVLAIRDGNNRVYYYAQPRAGAGPVAWVDTGGYAIDIEAGYQGEVYVRDGNNLVLVYQGPNGGWTNTGGYAIDMDAGLDSLNRRILAIRDGSGQVWVYGPLGTSAQYTPIDIIAVELAAGWGDIYIRDPGNRLWVYRAHSQQPLTNTGGLATSLRVVDPDTGFDPDQLAFLDGAGTLWFYEDAFIATGFTVRDVDGWTGNAPRSSGG